MKYTKVGSVYALGSSVGALFALAACSPSVPAESASEWTPTDSSKPVAVADELPASSNDPVPMPPSVLMTARLGDPVHDLPALGRFIHPTSDLAKGVLDNPRKVVRVLFGSLGPHINLEQPVDIAAFNPENRMPPVVSFALSDFSGARKNAISDFTFTKAQDGGLVVSPRPGAGHTGIIEKAHLACSVYGGTVANQARLVCSESAEARDIAGPYLARTSARQPVRPGLHVEFHESFIRTVLAKEEAKLKSEATSNSPYDKGKRLGGRLVQQAFDDMRNLSADVALDSGGVHGGLEFGFRSGRSPMSVGLLGTGTSSASIPAEFFRIPSDANMAFYFPGAARDDMRAAAEPFWNELADIELEGEALGIWKQFVPKLGRTFLTGGPCLMAHGSALGDSRIPAGLTDRSEVFRIARAATADWTLISTFEPVNTWTAALRDLLKKPTIFNKHSSAELARATDDRKSKTLDSTEEVTIVPSDGLPSGSLHIVRSHVPNRAYWSPDGPPLDGPYTQHFYIGGTKNITWMAISDNETTARTKLAEVLNPSSPGLAGRSDLTPLRLMPAGGIGFATLQGFAAMQANRDTLAGIGAQVRTERRLSADSGTNEPIFFSFASKGTPGGTALRVQARASDAVARALVEWIEAPSR